MHIPDPKKMKNVHRNIRKRVINSSLLPVPSKITTLLKDKRFRFYFFAGTFTTSYMYFLYKS